MAIKLPTLCIDSQPISCNELIDLSMKDLNFESSKDLNFATKILIKSIPFEASFKKINDELFSASYTMVHS